MDTALMEQFQQAYKDFDLSPLLEPEDIERFRVDYGLDVLLRLRREIEASELDGKFIFSGHRGCGKSTLVQLETNPNVAKINGTILNTAIRNIRNDFSRQISANLYEILIHIYREGVPLDRGDSGFVKLLHGLMILEYENDSLWYNVHPIVVDLLKQNQLVT